MLSQEPNSRILEGLKCKFNIKNGEKEILTVARLVPGKGKDAAIRALPKVLKNFSGVKYLVVGEGRYEKMLKGLSENIGVSAHVIFAGLVQQREVIKFCDLCNIL